MTRLQLLAMGVVLGASVLGCGPADSEEPLFPEDYLTSYTQVRDCRQSGDHDLNMVRVLAGPMALTPYQGRSEPFPVGAVVLKEEYEFGDVSCSGPIKQWTVMVKEPEGGDPDLIGWTWQRVDADRQVVTGNPYRCSSCHRDCGVPPDGYDGTCEVP